MLRSSTIRGGLQDKFATRAARSLLGMTIEQLHTGELHTGELITASTQNEEVQEPGR
jgi:hypothetical protein